MTDRAKTRGAEGGAPLRVTTVTSDDEFARMGDEWDALLADAHAPSIFLSYEWIWPWWTHFGEGELAVFTVRERDRLVGIVPMMKTVRRCLGLPMMTLRSMTNTHSPRFDLAVAKGRVEEVVAAWWDHVVGCERWDVMELDYVPRDSEALAYVARRAERGRVVVRRVEQMASPVLHVASSWRDYFGGLSTTFRRNVEYAERKLDQAGGVSVTEVNGGSALDDALGIAFRIEASGWKGAEGTAIVCSDAEDGFYRAIARRAAVNGRLHLYFLVVGGREIAFDLCLNYGNTLNLVKIGYEPGPYAKFSPGVVLRKKVLESVFRGGRIQRYEMLGRASGWKLKWTNAVVVTERVFFYRRGIRPTLQFLIQFGIPEWAKRWVVVRRVLAWRSTHRTRSSA